MKAESRFGFKDERLKVMGRKLQLVESMACSGCKASAGSCQEGAEVAAASAEGVSSSREERVSNNRSMNGRDVGIVGARGGGSLVSNKKDAVMSSN